MSKSVHAYSLCAKWLLENNPGATFWTFTFRECQDDDEAMERWNYATGRARDSLLRRLPEVYGLRVTELHLSHGIHFHSLLNQRVPIDIVYQCFWPQGFGRIEGKKADEGSVEYLKKYLRPSTMRDDAFRGRRLWGRVGKWPAGGVTACKDVVVENSTTANYRFLHRGQKIGFAQMLYLGGLSKQFGYFSQWPDVVKRQYLGVAGRGKDHRVEFDRMAMFKSTGIGKMLIDKRDTVKTCADTVSARNHERSKCQLT